MQSFENDLHLYPFLKKAVESKNEDILDMIMLGRKKEAEGASPSWELLSIASSLNDLDFFKKVLLHLNFSQEDLRKIFRNTCLFESAKLVDFLIKTGDYSKDIPEAFIEAAAAGRGEIIKKLLPEIKSEVKSKEIFNKALYVACRKEKTSLVCLLSPLADCDGVLKSLEEHPENSAVIELRNFVKVITDKTTLLQAIEKIARTKLPLKS